VAKILAELKVRYPLGGISGAAGADFPMMTGSETGQSAEPTE